jgi:transposase
MAATGTEVSTIGLVDTTGGSDRPKRRQWSEAVKHQIVSETRKPGASVSIVARRHDVNSNQVFRWRRELLVGPPAVAAAVPLLPVEVVSEPSGEARPRARRSGVIEITFGCGARVCLRGEVPPETLRHVIELLR